MTILKRLTGVAALLLISFECCAQRWAISTNAVEWANLFTINGEVSVAVHRNVSLNLNARYNPWSFRTANGDILMNKTRAISFGFRAWPWVTNSGWWIAVAAQMEEYSYAVANTIKPQDGYAYGGVLGAGYSLLITPHFNIDFGLLFWGGMKRYWTYDTAVYGRVTDSGKKFFFLPDDIRISAVYVF